MEEWATDEQEIALLRERVDEAARVAVTELKEIKDQGKGAGRRRKRDDGVNRDDRDRDDDVVEAGMPGYRHKRSRR